MSTVSASIEIEASPLQVWEAIMDPDRLAEWVTIHRRLHRADGGPPKVGYVMDQQIHLRGVSVDVHWSLEECKPCERAVWLGRGPARSRARIEYRLRGVRSGSATRFDYSNEFHAPLGPIGALASRALVGGIPRREANLTLARLRSMLER